MRLCFLIFTLFSILLSNQTLANTTSRAVPEAFTGLNYKKASYGQSQMISAANPHAVNAGLEMLTLGGNAADAVVALQLVLTLVEPQSSGIGGGAFMLWHDGNANTLTSFDGRETAPEKATSKLFYENGKPVKWIDAVVGGRSVGVPGVLKMLAKVHQEYGKLPWDVLFKPAITLAEQGFVVSPRLAKLVQVKMNPGLDKLNPAKDYFYPNGQPIKAGDKLVNKAYAQTLKLIAKEGIKGFYSGELSKKIAKSVQNSEVAPGLLSQQDLQNYTEKQREAVCASYKAATGDYDVCSMGPPSSGGITVLQILKLLEPFDLAENKIDSLETVHLYTQAARLAFADRDKYIADPDFTHVPIKQMLDVDYLLQRSKLINTDKDLGKAVAGDLTSNLLAENVSIAQPNTSHISIVDKDGNAVSMTTSIEMGFGSTVMVGGFLLNNQLTDFSFVGEQNGKLVANRVQGNKRPRSSMAPVIVYKDKKLYAVLGSPGGSRIINYVGYALVGLLEYGMDMQQVADMPRLSNRNGYTSIEKGTQLELLKPKLEAMGHTVKSVEMTSGIHGILKTDKGWQGAADPRREGTARGLD